MRNIINNGEETAGHRYVLSTDCQGKEEIFTGCYHQLTASYEQTFLSQAKQVIFYATTQTRREGSFEKKN